MAELIKKIKKIGFTDKFGLWTAVVCGVFIFACLAVFTFTNKDPLPYAISVIGFLTTLYGFIINKNKKENVAKISVNPNNCETDNTELQNIDSQG